MYKPHFFFLWVLTLFGCTNATHPPIEAREFANKTFIVINETNNDTMVIDFHGKSYSMHKEGTYQKFYRPWRIKHQNGHYSLVLDGWSVIVKRNANGGYAWSAIGLRDYAATVQERSPKKYDPPPKSISLSPTGLP